MTLVHRLLAVLLFALALGGCAALNGDTRREEVFDPSPAAKVGYLYAQLAENVYLPHSTFKLPPELELVQQEENDATGFAYSVFHRKDGARLAEVILAFRGTETPKDGWGATIQDWFLGNLLQQQNEKGRLVYERLRLAHPDRSLPITVTGHSLGGAIALHVSLRSEGAKAVVFNTSSAFTRGAALDNERLSFSDYGEPAKILRASTIAPKWVHVIANCTEGFDPLKNHSQARLAACLTRLAAEAGDASAQRSMELNAAIFSAR